MIAFCKHLSDWGNFLMKDINLNISIFCYLMECSLPLSCLCYVGYIQIITTTNSLR